MPILSQPDPLVPPPPTFRHCLDAYIFSSVLFYSALRSSYPSTLYLLSALSTLVLLLNALYLHAPCHPPSLLLALISAFLPLYRFRASLLLYRVVTALPDAPFVLVEAAIGAVLIGNFIRLAIFRPLAHAREQRRQTAPIPVQTPPPSHLVRQEWLQAAQAQAAESAHQTNSGIEQDVNAPTEANDNPTNTDRPAGVGRPSTSVGEPTQKTAASVADALLAADRTLQSATRSAATVDDAREAARAALHAASARAEASSASGQPSAPRRRKKKVTQSQLLAAQILREREAEEAARRAAAERAQEAIRLASENARAAREARQRERESLQENVREAAKGVIDAKENFKRKSLEADRARQERRRAADQLKIRKCDENETALDDACKEAARMEMEEQRALDDVNAAQGRLTDLRDQLNRFSTRHPS